MLLDGTAYLYMLCVGLSYRPYPPRGRLDEAGHEARRLVMRHTEAMAELGTSGGIDVRSLIAMGPADVGSGSGTERTPDDHIAKKAGRGF